MIKRHILEWSQDEQLVFKKPTDAFIIITEKEKKQIVDELDTSKGFQQNLIEN